MIDRGLDTPVFTAAIDMVRRTGAKSIRIGFYEDEPPTIWHVTATYSEDRHEVAAGMAPLTAALRLCAQLVDGARCVHCRQVSAFDESLLDSPVPAIPGFCWYKWDPELRTFRRGCE